MIKKNSSTVWFGYALVWKPSCRRRGLKRKISSSYRNIKETRWAYGLFCTIITLLMKLPDKSSAAYTVLVFFNLELEFELEFDKLQTKAIAARSFCTFILKRLCHKINIFWKDWRFLIFCCFFVEKPKFEVLTYFYENTYKIRFSSPIQKAAAYDSKNYSGSRLHCPKNSSESRLWHLNLRGFFLHPICGGRENSDELSIQL